MVRDTSRQSINLSLLLLIINKLYRHYGKETMKQNKYSKNALQHKHQIKIKMCLKPCMIIISSKNGYLSLTMCPRHWSQTCTHWKKTLLFWNLQPRRWGKDMNPITAYIITIINTLNSGKDIYSKDIKRRTYSGLGKASTLQ